MYRFNKNKEDIAYDTITYHEIWFGNLETLVQNVYGVKISVAEMLDYPNQDTYITFTVDGESELDAVADKRIVSEWAATGKLAGLDLGEFATEYYQYGEVSVRHVLHRLYIDGHIPAGEWLLTIWW